MPTDGRVIVIDLASRAWRRDLDPSAWSLFEELMLASTGPASQREATVSVRSLATSTGLAKDTVARALIRLRRAGLVEADQSRTTGVFSAGSYRLNVPTGIRVEDRICVPAAVDAQPSPSTHRARPDQAQLSLAIEA